MRHNRSSQMRKFHVTFLIWIGEVKKIGVIKRCFQQCPTLDDKKNGSIHAWHDHSQRTQVEVIHNVSSMQSWMTKFDNNLSTITGLLSRLKPLLLGSQVPPA